MLKLQLINRVYAGSMLSLQSALDDGHDTMNRVVKSYQKILILKLKLLQQNMKGSWLSAHTFTTTYRLNTSLSTSIILLPSYLVQGGHSVTVIHKFGLVGNQTHTYTHTCTHTRTHTCTRVHTCTHARTNTHVYTHIHVHTHVYTHTHTHTCTHTHTHTHTRVHTHLHVYTSDVR